MVPNTAFNVGMLDLTHPNTSSWFREILQEMVDDGVRGWMADFGEGLPVDATLYSGYPNFPPYNDIVSHLYPDHTFYKHKIVLQYLYSTSKYLPSNGMISPWSRENFLVFLILIAILQTIIAESLLKLLLIYHLNFAIEINLKFVIPIKQGQQMRFRFLSFWTFLCLYPGQEVDSDLCDDRYN